MNRQIRLIPLELSQFLLGETRVIYPMLLTDGADSLLIDTGYPGQAALLLQKMAEAGISPDSLSSILLTHHDIDHIGSLPELVSQALRKITVLTSAEEKPYVEGDKPILKFSSLSQEQLKLMPEEMSGALLRLMNHPPKAPVDVIVEDGEPLPFAEEWIVVATPGHTPGHISLFDRTNRILLAGDALEVKQGKLFGPDPALCHDPALAYASVKKLAALEPAEIWCYHGGCIKATEQPQRQLNEIRNRA